MPSWKNKLVTVFGGTGFVGRYVVKRLARLGARVIVPTRDTEKALPLKPNGDVGQIVVIAGSIQDDAFVRRAIEGSDAVVNLVGLLAESGKSRFENVQAAFPARLAAMAQAAGVKKFVHVSAIGADEKSASRYAVSKAKGEAAVRAGFPAATILRPSLIIGPEDKFFNLFASLALLFPALPLPGGGKTRFQPVYVGDVADAVVAALGYEGAGGKVFELGGPAIFSFKQLMQMMLAQTGLKRCLIPLPFFLMSLKAFFLQFLPGKLLTPDQVTLLKKDNVAQDNAPGLRDLGITPTAIETVLPTYMDRYRKGGRFRS
jgi:uncharacterized protein YbjT (DUF2867 family)